MFWFYSLWEQLCHSVGTCYSARLQSPNSFPRPLSCTRPQSPHGLPLALTFQVLLKGVVVSLLLNGHTVIWSCYLVRRLNPTVVLPWELSIAVSRCFSRGNLTQLNSALTFLKSPLNTEYKLSSPIFNAHPSTFLPHFPNFLLFRLPLRFKDHFTVCLFE